MKANKKGVSLAFVIVVVLALVILSSMLFTAAARSMSMTGRSTEGRAAYLKAKSAIEYAKTEVYNLAKSNTLTAFSIGPSGDYFEPIVAQAPNGTSCLAECAPEADGKTWKITAKVKYSGFEQYRQMSYSFTLEQHKSAPVGLPASDFLAAGVSYGTNRIFGQSNWYPTMNSATTSYYPVVENMPVYTSGKQGESVTAPEIFLLGETSDANRYSLDVNYGPAEIHSDGIFVAGNIFTSSSSGINWKDSTQIDIYNTSVMSLYPSTADAKSGVIYFAGIDSGNCLVVRGNNKTPNPADAKITIPSGYYSFESGFDLASIVAASGDGSSFLDHYGKSGAKKMTKLSESAVSAAFQQDTTFVKNSYVNGKTNILSGGSWGDAHGANFESNGVFGENSLPPSYHNQNNGAAGNHWSVYSGNTDFFLDDSTVFTYATSTGWSSGTKWPAYQNPGGIVVNSDDYSGSYRIYCAKQFFLSFVSSVNNFVTPSSCDVAFHSDFVLLNMQASDSNAGVEPGSVGTHRPEIVQSGANTHFQLTNLCSDVYEAGVSTVTLAVSHTIRVSLQDGTNYTIPSGIYNVNSGFNFFEAKKDWTGFWSGCRKGDYSSSGSGSGSSGTTGGFTITPGQYSVS